MKIEIITGRKWKYRLPEEESFSFRHSVDDSIDTPFIKMEKHKTTIKKGYCWDGSSIPLKRIVKFISFGFCDLDKYCKKASLTHDVFYQLMQLNHLAKIHKDRADERYRLECIAGGMSKWEADIRFWVLQKRGSVEKKEKPIIIIEV